LQTETSTRLLDAVEAEAEAAVALAVAKDTNRKTHWIPRAPNMMREEDWLDGIVNYWVN
jgi:hypothetical protein